jgi:hypothetical protein
VISRFVPPIILRAPAKRLPVRVSSERAGCVAPPAAVGFDRDPEIARARHRAAARPVRTDAPPGTPAGLADKCLASRNNVTNAALFQRATGVLCAGLWPGHGTASSAPKSPRAGPCFGPRHDEVGCLPVQPGLQWRMSARKITFGEMRATGVRGLLIYCSDFRCSHWTAISGDRWPDGVRLSLGDLGPTVLGFRMPAFEAKERVLKRPMWNWLLDEADRLRASSALIVGDFNTAPGDSETLCGDCLTQLVQGGWQHVRPASGYSWRHPQFRTERQIDHIFLSASLVPRRVEYSWDFERLAPKGTSRKVGRPDHAMLVCEFD